MKKGIKLKPSTTDIRRSKLHKRETAKAWFFILPSFLGIILFVLLPFLDVVKRSFYDAMGGNFTGLDNYKLVLKNEAFRLAIKNTFRFLVTCIPLLLLLALVLSLLLYYQKKYAVFFKTSFLLPMDIPIASVVLLWRLLFSGAGLINSMFMKFGWETIDFMNTDKAFLVLLISYLWKNTGYNIVLWLTGLNEVAPTLYEAADVDGAGFFQKFYYITLPCLRPTIFVVTIMAFINSFKVFREAYLVAGDYPHESIYMLQHLLNNWFMNLDIQKMSATAVMYVCLFILLIILFQRFNKGVDEK